jgi:hypothetical protein
MRCARWGFLVVVLVACSGGGNASDDGGAAPPVTSGSPDSGQFAFSDDSGTDAGELLAPCTPGVPSSCPSGFTCYSQHTSATWWVDLYGTCTFDCNGQTDALCDSLDGVCGCPVPEGEASDAGPSCAVDSGISMVCVPALKPGTSPAAGDE